MGGFTQIPANLRLPGVVVEFDPSRATTGTPAISHKLLVIGQRLSTGAVLAGVPTLISADDQAEQAWGRGSMLAEMVKALRKANRYIELYGIAVDEDGDGVAATGSIGFAGPATAAGTLALYIGGKRVRVGVASGATAAQIATATIAAINADTTLPVTAAVDGGNTALVNLTCRWKGATGNDIDLRLNYYTGESTPAGVTPTITAMASGATNPDIADAIAGFGPEWWTYIVNPFNDTSNLNTLSTELIDRWGAMRNLRTICFGAYRGTHGVSTTFGAARNDYPISTMATGLAPTAPWIWAAVYGAIAAGSLSNDPAEGLQTLALPGILPPALQQQFTSDERNTQLFKGLSTYTADSDGTVRIQMAITMYQKNAANIADTAWYKVQTLAINMYLCFARQARLSQKFSRSKLADDGTNFEPGQNIVTPDRIRTELIDVALLMEKKGLMENIEQYKRDLVVVRDLDDRNRVNVFESPDHVNQLDLIAIRIAWIN